MSHKPAMSVQWCPDRFACEKLKILTSVIRPPHHQARTGFNTIIGGRLHGFLLASDIFFDFSMSHEAATFRGFPIIIQAVSFIRLYYLQYQMEHIFKPDELEPLSAFIHCS